MMIEKEAELFMKLFEVYDVNGTNEDNRPD